MLQMRMRIIAAHLFLFESRICFPFDLPVCIELPRRNATDICDARSMHVFIVCHWGALIGYGARAQCQQGETSVCLIEHENKNANKLFPSIEPTLMAAVSITVQPFVRRHIPQCAIQIDDDHSSVRRNERVHNTDGMELIRTRTKCKWEWNIELTAIQQNNVRFYCIIFSIANANDQMTNH